MTPSLPKFQAPNINKIASDQVSAAKINVGTSATSVVPRISIPSLSSKTDVISGTASSLTEKLSGATNSLTDRATTDAIKGKFPDVPVFPEFKLPAIGLSGILLNAGPETLTNVIPSLQAIVPKWVPGLTINIGMIAGAISAAKALASGGISGVLDGLVDSVVGDATSAVTGAVNGVVGSATGLVDNAKNTATNATSNVIGGATATATTKTNEILDSLPPTG
jgi:hypothetical protein